VAPMPSLMVGLPPRRPNVVWSDLVERPLRDKNYRSRNLRGATPHIWDCNNLQTLRLRANPNPTYQRSVAGFDLALVEPFGALNAPSISPARQSFRPVKRSAFQ